MLQLAPLALGFSIATLSSCAQTQASERSNLEHNAALAKRFAFTYDALAPRSYGPLLEGGSYHPDLQGAWKARGYGFYFEVDEDRLRWYSATAGHAWEHSPEGELDLVFAIERTSGRCYLKPYETESALILEPLDQLPEIIASETQAGPIATFERIDQTMQELFPFFEERGHDWESRALLAREQIDPNLSPAGLFSVLEGMFEGLGDGHTSLTAEIDGEERVTAGSMSTIRQALEADYASQSDTVSRPDYFGAWSQRLFAGIEDTLLHGEAQSAFDENLIWGKIRPEVGYLLVRDMASYGDEDDDLLTCLSRLHGQLEEIFAGFADCEAIILDVSFNRGGFHSFALAFASHLADRDRYAFCKYPKGSPDLLQKFHVRPFCDSSGRIKTFTKPVYIVTTDACVSAGEEFVLAARPFPHVQVVGTPTQGMLSDILEKQLPGGWLLGLANEIFLDHEGRCFEVTGIPVDRHFPIFDLENIEQVGHADSLLSLAEEIVASPR